LRLAQYGDGARRSRRFNDQKHKLLGKPSPLAFSMLMRRERRAPLAPNSCHPVLRVSKITPILAAAGDAPIYPFGLQPDADFTLAAGL